MFNKYAFKITLIIFKNVVFIKWLKIRFKHQALQILTVPLQKYDILAFKISLVSKYVGFLKVELLYNLPSLPGYRENMTHCAITHSCYHPTIITEIRNRVSCTWVYHTYDTLLCICFFFMF